MATRTSLIESGQKLLSSASVPSTRREIEWLMQEADSCSRIDLLAEPDAPISAVAEQRFDSFIARRLAREPVQYILGYTEFYGHRIVVNPSVLIPRPETELLVDYALSRLGDFQSPKVVDIGTGSGCIALSIKKALPASAVVGVDISRKALDTARENAGALEVDVSWLECDMGDPTLVEQLRPLIGASTVDLIVSNPPYVPPEERESLEAEILRYEPQIALFTGSDATYPYRQLALLAAELLSTDGELVVEIHADHGSAVRRTLEAVGFSMINCHTDLSGRERMITARMAR